MNILTSIQYIGALAFTAGTAVAADPATVAADPVLSSVIIESDASPAKREPLVPVTPFLEEAAREEARRMITRMDRPDGSTVYRYNGFLQERLVMTRGEDGKMHVVCGDLTHTHGAAQPQVVIDDR